MRRRRIDPELLDRALLQPSDAQEELAELLVVARAVAEAFETHPREAAVERGRERALAAFHFPEPATERKPHTLVSPWEWLPQLRVRVLASAAMVIAILGALVAGSYGSLPGDALYGVKLGVEQVRLAAAVDPIDQAQVHLDIAQSRIVEVVRAKEAGRSDAMRESLRRYTVAIVQVQGDLQGDLSGLQARQVLAEAAGTIQAHEEVLVELRPGTPAPAKPDLENAIQVLAEIQLPEPPPPTPESPTPGPTTTPTESPSPTPTDSPSPDPSVTPTDASPSGDPSPEPTPSESPSNDQASGTGDGVSPAPQDSPATDGQSNDPQAAATPGPQG